MLIKTRAIVLHSIKFGESQYIVDMFVEETGRVSFIQKVLPSGRGKIRKQLFQPLSLLDIEFDLRPKVRLQRLKEARLLVPYATIPFDPYKLSLTILWLSFCFMSPAMSSRTSRCSSMWRQVCNGLTAVSGRSAISISCS